MEMNYERIYDYRFQDVNQAARRRVWKEIATYLYDHELGKPSTVLDPASGRCEFINAVPAAERWCVDAVDQADGRDVGVQFTRGDALTVNLPLDHFDAVFVSNFLEHLPDPATIAVFLGRMLCCLRPEGRIVVVGPNFKYCPDEYFDCADHITALTHLSVAEHLHGAGFQVIKVIPRFLPFSFRGLLPPSPQLTKLYLRFPLIWPLLGKQFMVVGSRPT